MAQDIQRSMDAGYDRHLTKSLEIKSLCAAIAEVMKAPPRGSPQAIEETEEERIRRAILD